MTIRTLLLGALLSPLFLLEANAYEVKPVTEAQAAEYKLDPAFYKKATMADGILIATSDRVSDFTHLEAAYL